MSREMKKLRIDDAFYETEIPEELLKSRYRGVNSHEIRAVIPGTITEVRVQEGEKVTAGQVIIILEAMKMLNDVEARIDGRIAELKVSVGDRVGKDQIMAMVEE
ncbi:acetyl-CoA carboxylase biotin carboxyl carrier protein subunit [Deltaproteobacteria bacterium]|nr:acetyl-CoA carboxylase biotin carboxyl carrier protein subunit [Deltaproteobacteria bacterium]